MTTTIYVQFSDVTESTIIGILGGPQDPEVWPNQGSVPSTDPRYAAWYEAQPPFMQQFAISPGA